jgi:hypothetical protein
VPEYKDRSLPRHTRYRTGKKLVRDKVTGDDDAFSWKQLGYFVAKIGHELKQIIQICGQTKRLEAMASNLF